nr:MAG TPA: hypothetical protein [Caudoviricetes sp.]
MLHLHRLLIRALRLGLNHLLIQVSLLRSHLYICMRCHLQWLLGSL